MKRSVLAAFLIVVQQFCFAQIPRLKSVIYDFDGLNIGETDLPDGDYKNGDLTYHAAATPLVSSDVLGDRVLQLDLNWSSGSGEFGKDVSRFIDLAVSVDRLNFYFYDPLSNPNDSLLQIFITEDDNSNNVYEYALDDKWIYTTTIQRQANWQLFSIPLSSFTDENSGGNGIFDVGYSGTGSRFGTIGFVFTKTSSGAIPATFYMDMISFSEGLLPTGNSILGLPAENTSGKCMLGALANNDFPDATPDTINNLFSKHKLTFVNWFLDYSKTGTTANAIPGDEVQHLLDNGYTPVITWEMMYEQYSRLDPVQPRLNQLLAGIFDNYIDDFADKIKSYNKTVIIRIFHEFDGNWYPWSLTENDSDPNKYISAFRYVVNRFRARGTENVQWMWCVNAEPKPYVDYNWIIEAYPGDSYVDIVATDIYNHPDLGTPAWKSFRYTLAESYYYLTKYFPDKPFYICEVASRERYSSEPLSSQTKGEWICQMSRDLKSYFGKTKALIFFSLQKEHDWRVNSSFQSLSAVTDCVWNDNYFGAGRATVTSEETTLNAYPNPFIDEITLAINELPDVSESYEIRIFSILGEKLNHWQGYQKGELYIAGREFSPGMYIIEFKNGSYSSKVKVIKVKAE
jgi:hypothetical protein